jgi:hypothetical protein
VNDTLLSDIDTSITVFFGLYLFCNGVILASSGVVILVPLLIGAKFLKKRWGFLSAAFGAVLTSLGLSGVSANFIQARNDLQVAKYQYYTDKDRDKLIAAYAKAKTLAAFIPATDQGQKKPDASGKQPAQKSP